MKHHASTTQLPFTNKKIIRDRNFGLGLTLIMVSILTSACTSTQSQLTNQLNTTPVFERMNEQCIESVIHQQSMLENANPAQYLSLANTAEHCVGNIAFSPQHPDTQIAMKFSALAIMNLIKAGDIEAASNGLAKFRAIFPQQDLLFDDYSSFVDTATALLKQQDLSSHQLALLNINPKLRGELTRKRQWSLQ